MNYDWRSIHRVGQQLGLSDDEFERFLEVALEVHEDKLDEAGHLYSLDDEYFDFLNNEVFSDDAVLKELAQYEVAESSLKEFRNSNFDIKSAFREYSKFEYGLDEIADIAMIIHLCSLFKDMYANVSFSRRRLQYLIYLTNNELSEREDFSAKPKKTDLGMLERTGYRYTFRKHPRSVRSSRLSQDRNRMVASKLLNEIVRKDVDPNEGDPFLLSLDSSGEKILRKCKPDLQSLKRADSHHLREWAICQSDIISEWGDVPLQDLEEHVLNVNDYDDKGEGGVLLTGRARSFDMDPQETFQGILEEVQNAHV